MKLKTPETWETQIALHGNKPEVWQKLIDDKKLPYMATVRNIRNILLAGVSETHIKKVASYISNETAVSKSRMFPFQYFTAYDILNEVKEIKEKGNKPKPKNTSKEKEKEKWMLKKEEKQKQLIKTLNLSHMETLRKSLDKAVNIAARNNIPPMKGRTLILCAYGLEMTERFTEAKGVSQKGSTIRDAAALFSIMCQQAAEDSKLYLFSAKHLEVTLPGNDILSNVEYIKRDTNINKKIGLQNVGSGAQDVLDIYLKEEKWVDNVIIFHGSQNSSITESMYRKIKKMRQDVNPNMLYANINICERPNIEKMVEETLYLHPNDLSVCGFNDSIFQLIVNKGNGGQLAAVEMIDRKYNLITLQSPLSTTVTEHMQFDSLEIPQWQKVRIFVSSTFLDMQGERNILHQFVLPQLQKRAKEKYIQVDLVDLRWGLSQESLKSRSQLEQCLEQINRCDLFVGILGERYGWVPDQSMKDDLPQKYEDLKMKCSGKEVSMTEMEMEFGALSCAKEVKERAFFYLRNGSFCTELSQEEQLKFITQNEEHKDNLANLKQKIAQSGLEVMTNYPAHFSTDSRGQTIVGGLQDFGTQVLNNLWNAIDKLYPCLTESEDTKLETELKNQVAFCEMSAKEFVGRQKLVSEANTAISSCKSGVVYFAGAEGSGITAIMGKLSSDISKNKTGLVIPLLAEAATNSDMKHHLQYLVHTLGGGPQIMGTMQSLTVSLKQCLERYCATNSRVVIFMDDFQDLEDWNTSWIPDVMPENVVFVLKTKLGSKLNILLKKRKDTTEIVVKGLDMKDRISFCKSYLEMKGKSLEESAFNNQLQTVISKRSAGSPSYLKLILSKISKEANFESLTEQVRKLGSTNFQVLEDILITNEMLFGEKFVRLIMLFISQSKTGLSGNQISSLVPFYMFLEETQGFSASVEKLCDELQHFLSENQAMVSFMDILLCLEMLSDLFENSAGIIRLSTFAIAVVQERYIKPSKSSDIAEIHTILASYYFNQYSRDIVHPATIINLPYHIGYCGDYKMLKKLICTPDFIHHKCSMGLGEQLYRDYLGLSFKFRSAQEKFSKDPLVEEYRKFVKSNLETLMLTPCLIPQIILNEPNDSPIKKHFKEEELREKSNLAFFKWHNGPRTWLEKQKLGYTILNNHKTPTTCIKKINGMVISGYSDGSILLSDDETHEDLFCLVGHSEEITGIELFSSSILVSSSQDGWLSTWDLEKRIRLSSAKAHERTLSSLSVRHPIIVTASWDGVLKVWDKHLKNISKISQPNGPLNCVLVHPRKDICITGGWDKTIRVWDLESLKQKAVLRGHESSIQNIKLTENARKIISGSLDGVVKIWDCDIGTEVASFNVGQSCSVLELNPMNTQVFVGGNSGVITSWPLALGKQITNYRSQELLTEMQREFSPKERTTSTLDPTTLIREISALYVLDGGIWTGFKNGDVQLMRLENKNIKMKMGWKMFNSEIKFIGGRENYDLANLMWNVTVEDWSGGLDWNNMVDEYEQMEEEDSNDSDDLESMDEFFLPDVDLFDNPTSTKIAKKVGQRNTIWISSGSNVEVGTLLGDELEYSVMLEGINSEVTDIHLYLGIKKDYILVFASDGSLYMFDGHPVTKKTQTVQPIKIVDTQHGKVVKTVSLSSHFDMPVDVDFITIGEDRRMKTWKISENNGIVAVDKIYESSDVFLSKPVGIELVQLRDKYFIFVALEDGSLVRQEVKSRPKESGYNNITFGSKQTIEGNGYACVKMYSNGEYLVMEHSGGLVSLWSIKGSEICQYNKKSTATLFTSKPIMGKDEKKQKLLLASADLEIISPFESECLDKLCGHQGEIKCLLATGSNSLISTGLDGKVRHWNYSQENIKGQPVEKIVAIKTISTKKNNSPNTEFLVLSNHGSLSYWIWDNELAKEVGRISLETDRYELMDAVVLDKIIFLVTASRSGTVTLYEADLLASTLDVKLINKISLLDFPLGIKIHLEADEKQNNGEFSVLYSTSDTLSALKARTRSNPRGPRPMLMMQNRIYLENWDTEPDFQKIVEELRKEKTLGLQNIFGQSAEYIANFFLKLDKRAFPLFPGTEMLSCGFVAKDGGMLKCENHALSTVNSQKLHDKAISGCCVIDKKRIVTCSEDGRIKMWKGTKEDVAFFTQIGEFSGHGPAFTAIEHVGERVIVGDAAGNVFCLEVQ